jgi:hypothetical protein
MPTHQTEAEWQRGPGIDESALQKLALVFSRQSLL